MAITGMAGGPPASAWILDSLRRGKALSTWVARTVDFSLGQVVVVADDGNTPEALEQFHTALAPREASVTTWLVRRLREICPESTAHLIAEDDLALPGDPWIERRLDWAVMIVEDTVLHQERLQTQSVGRLVTMVNSAPSGYPGNVFLTRGPVGVDLASLDGQVDGVLASAFDEDGWVVWLRGPLSAALLEIRTD